MVSSPATWDGKKMLFFQGERQAYPSPDNSTSAALMDAGAKACQGVITTNAEDGVTWVHSYVTLDRKRTYCIYDAPAPEAIRRVADRNKLPVDRIIEVRVLDPCFYC